MHEKLPIHHANHKPHIHTTTQLHNYLLQELEDGTLEAIFTLPHTLSAPSSQRFDGSGDIIQTMNEGEYSQQTRSPDDN
jgi:hypothetical protein